MSAVYCRRCTKRVYHAEEARGGGQVYHKVCFKCKECKKKLDSSTLTPREDEKEIYCSSCWGRKFGPKGYGWGQGAGTLNMERVDNKNTPHKNDYNPSNNFGGAPRGGGGGAKFCPNCGCVKQNAKFCPECGTKQ